MQTRKFEVGKYIVEYIEELHLYIVNGVILPSITTIIKSKFPVDVNIPDEVLQNAKERGNRVHKEIEDFEKSGLVPLESQEFNNYLSLKNLYKFKVIDSEKIVVLEIDNKPVAVGRLDQVISINNELAINDIKSTSTLNRDYLYYQTNLYRIAHNQTYGTDIKLCYGTHLNKDTKAFKRLPTNTEIVIHLVKEYLKKKEENENE